MNPIVLERQTLNLLNQVFFLHFRSISIVGYSCSHLLSDPLLLEMEMEDM